MAWPQFGLLLGRESPVPSVSVFSARPRGSAIGGAGATWLSASALAQQSLVQLPIGLCEAVTAIEEVELIASDAVASDPFGLSVAISGDTAVVGAPDDDHGGGIDGGAAYVFLRGGSGWSEQAKLTASDASEDDEFGCSVAVSGDTTVIGALRSEGVAAGSAYVFRRSGTRWSKQQKLIGSDADSNDLFGSRVAISGDTLVVSAHADDYGPGTAPRSGASRPRAAPGLAA